MKTREKVKNYADWTNLLNIRDHQGDETQAKRGHFVLEYFIQMGFSNKLALQAECAFFPLSLF
jgi:hypothetical protein